MGNLAQPQVTNTVKGERGHSCGGRREEIAQNMNRRQPAAVTETGRKRTKRNWACEWALPLKEERKPENLVSLPQPSASVGTTHPSLLSLNICPLPPLLGPMRYAPVKRGCLRPTGRLKKGAPAPQQPCGAIFRLTSHRGRFTSIGPRMRTDPLPEQSF